MSISLEVRFVYGYNIPEDLPRIFEEDSTEGVCVESVECMGGDSGMIVYSAESEVPILNDRDGYDISRSLLPVSELPDTSKFDPLLEKFILGLPKKVRPKTKPQWLLHTDMG